MILNFFAYFGTVILFFNLIFYILRFKNNSKSYKIFTLYMFVFFGIQIASIVLLNRNTDSVFFSHVQFISQFILLSLFYKEIFADKSQKKAIIIVIFFVLLALSIQYFFDKKQFYIFNLFEILITYLPIIAYAATHFYNMLNSKKQYFFINSGILIYMFGTMAIFIAGNILSNIYTNISILIFVINMTTYITFQIFIMTEWIINFYKKSIDNE